MILGLSGGKGHGKDTFASMLIRAVPSFRPVSFAKRLKEICCAAYGLTWAQVDDELGKEMTLPEPIDLDAGLVRLQAETGLSIGAKNLVARTPRQVLQLVGTDYVRSADPDYWLNIVGAQFDAAPGGDFVVTDVRFPNENDFIRRRGGRTLRVLRLAKAIQDEASGREPEHASEALAFQPDYTLGVMEDDFSLHGLICGFARRGMLLDGLQAFNWDHVSFSAPVCAAYYRDIWAPMNKAAAEMMDREPAPAAGAL